jgi:membrane-associated protease RseP (regulator of RpoE activity)
LTQGEHRKGISLVVSRRGRFIRGFVIDDRGQPLVGVSVMAAPELSGRSFKRAAQGQRALSSNDGSFNIDDLPAGLYTVFASHPERAPATRSGVAAGSAEVRLTLGRAGSLAGTVVDRSGKPLLSYTLLVVPPSHRRETAAMRLEGAPGEALPIPVSNPTGAFELTGLAAGGYDLHVSTADGLHGSLEGVEVVAGERRGSLRIVASPGARLTGRVLELGTERPLVAEIVMPGEKVRGTRSDSMGAFSLDDVAPARERMIEISTPGEDHVRERWSVAVPVGQKNVDVGVVWLMPGPDRRLEPRGGGTGLYLGKTPTQLVIFEVRPGSPGERNGIRPGDQLLAIDGRDVHHYGQRAAGLLLMGEPATPVSVRIARPGQAPQEFQLVRSDHQR